jgi:hypothetical protein
MQINFIVSNNFALGELGMTHQLVFAEAQKNLKESRGGKSLR